MTMEAAMSPGAPLLFDTPQPAVASMKPSAARMLLQPAPNVLFEYNYASPGEDIERLFDRCDYVFEDQFITNRTSHFHLEPHVTVARERRGYIEIWACNQDPFELRRDVARIFRRPEGAVRVHTHYVGGGFGGKSFCKMEPVAVLLALKAGRPVRLCLSLDESFHTICNPEVHATLKTGAMADGTLVVRASDILVNSGAYADANCAVAIKAGHRVGGPYRWRAVSSRARCVRTNTVPGGSFRGFGGTQVTWASESQVDMIARRLGLDPREMRLKNLLAVGEPFLPNERPMDSDLRAGLDIVARRLGYGRRKKGSGRGLGLSVGVKDGGGTANHGQATIKVATDGSIIVHAGTVEIGQGAATAMCAIAAEVLNAPLAAVRYGAIDTDHTPLDPGTRASSGVVLVGKAVELAALDVRRQVLSFAADRLGCRTDELTLDAWTILRGNERFPMPGLILGFHGGAGYEFMGRGYVKVPFEPAAPMGAKVASWIPCFVGADVEVDCETGRLHVHQLVVGGDAGRVISEQQCRGQLEGAAVQAYGQALLEELKYYGGAMVNGSPMRYRVPLATDLPDRLVSIILEQGMGPGPFGAKAIGEAGMLGIASAIANAIEDAIGVRVNALPIAPERLLVEIDRVRSGARDQAAQVDQA
jgi:CO/xanthine dehydrogenase Mo-binding subunit